MKKKKTKQPETGPAVPNAKFWLAMGNGQPLFLEAERWVDARRAARTVLACEVTIGPALDRDAMPADPAPRIQVRWVGMAARRIPDLRMQIRKVDEHRNAGAWRDL